MFVVLSPPMVEQPHTRAWVGYEVGVAADLDLPVVVIEPEGTTVPLHLPGATHYIRRPKSVLDGLSPAWKHLAKTAGRLVDREWVAEAETLGEKIWEFLYNAATADMDTSGLFKRAVCDHPDCKSRFYVPDDLYGGTRIPCPICRRDVASFRVKLSELSEKALAEAERAEAARPTKSLSSRGTRQPRPD